MVITRYDALHATVTLNCTMCGTRVQWTDEEIAAAPEPIDFTHTCPTD